MQPTFNPWIGYFDLIDYVDTFVFLDTVQLARRSWQIRNKLKINNSEFMFTIPIVKEKSRDELLIKDAQISYTQFDFRDKLLNHIKQNYKKAPFFNELIEDISNIIKHETIYLAEHNINFIIAVSKMLDLKTSFVKASDLSGISGAKGDLIFNICENLNSSTYVSALGSKEYLQNNQEDFDKALIRLEYQYYQHPNYEQVGADFIPYLGVLDLLFNEGVVKSKEIILKGRSFAT